MGSSPMIWKRRYTVLSILFAAYMLCYLDRMVMASAIPFIALDFHLSATAMGVVLSAFFAGYALMQIPGGVLADRLGPRPVLVAGIAWWSVFTALTGFVNGIGTLLTVRVVFGLGEGPFPAAASKTLANWFPARELGRASGLQQASTYLGAAIAPLIVASLIPVVGWRAIFSCLFLPGVVLAILVWRYVGDRPIHAGYVTNQAVDNAGLGKPKGDLRVSFKTPAVRWCAASLFLSNVVSWGLMNWLPTYLLRAKGYSVAEMGILASVTNFAGAAGFVLGGYVCDKYFIGRLRVPLALGLFSSAVFTYLAAILPGRGEAVACLVLVFIGLNISFTAIFTLPLVIVPKHAVGGAFGIVNTAGQLAGVLAPTLVGSLLDLTNGNFRIVLFVMVGFTLAAIYPALRIHQSTDAHELSAEAM
jgi:sugar phosphate permease